MLGKSHALPLALLLSTIWGATPAAVSAQESAIVDALTSGQIASKSLMALPTNQAAPLPGVGGDDDVLFGISREKERDITDRAYPLMGAKWPFNKVFVCWEEDDPQYFAQRTLVREAIRDTWETNSGLEFIGWNTCNEGASGILIHVEDTGPHVKFLGKFVNGVRHGMVLNFTYDNWSPVCQTMADYCNRAIAVHEFGHAIGFAHEQNRPDTPGECTEPPQGSSGDTLLTPWDPHSVMNYCNQKYSNDGVLSEFDVAAVQYIYGTRK